MRRGFTLLELMVASLLVAMLVTMLTMIFNQSSIAWRTGVAGIADLEKTRSDLGQNFDVRDEILPGIGGEKDVSYRNLGVFNGCSLRTDRPLKSVSVGGLTYDKARKGDCDSVANSSSGKNVSLFTVGVRSVGPDGVSDTNDDITTYPEGVK